MAIQLSCVYLMPFMQKNSRVAIQPIAVKIRGFMPFSRCNSSKVNEIAWLGFELVFFDVAASPISRKLRHPERTVFAINTTWSSWSERFLFLFRLGQHKYIFVCSFLFFFFPFFSLKYFNAHLKRLKKLKCSSFDLKQGHTQTCPTESWKRMMIIRNNFVCVCVCVC